MSKFQEIYEKLIESDGVEVFNSAKMSHEDAWTKSKRITALVGKPICQVRKDATDPHSLGRPQR